ncbi:sensor histidine kinase, partial [Streptosporangium algeriense]
MTPASGERHAYHRMDGWERLYLLDLVISVGLVLVDGRLTVGWKAVVLCLLGGCTAAYVLLGRRVPGEPHGANRRVYVVLSIVLFTPASVLCPATRFLLFAFGPQYYILLPKRQAMLATLALNAAPLLYLPLLPPREGDLIALFVIGLLSLASNLVFGPWIQDIIEQSQGRALLIEELENSRAEVARLSAERGAAAERERLAGEIHDTLAQGFTSIIMLVQAAQEQRDPARHLRLAVRTAEENLAEARALITALGPAPLISGSTLEEALGRMVSRFGEEVAVAVSFEVSGESRPMWTGAEVVLLRAAQEALANVRKHAHASVVAVTLDRLPSTARLSV